MVNVTIISRQKNKVHANLCHQVFSKSSRDEIIIGNVGIYFKAVAENSDYFYLQVMITNLGKKEDGIIYLCKFSSHKLGIFNQQYICDDSSWRELWYQDTENDLNFVYDLLIELEVIEKKNPFTVLYDDTELTDFEMSASDGSVKFHSAALATASPTLRRMLSGKWSETENRNLYTEDTTRKTLQHLKDYLYLNTLPDSGTENLLLLANYYLMSDLENKCIDKLLSNITLESSEELVKFALSHKLTKLYHAFLKLVKEGGVNIEGNKMQE